MDGHLQVQFFLGGGGGEGFFSFASYPFEESHASMAFAGLERIANLLYVTGIG